MYYFLEDVFPEQPGGFRILRTPGILYEIYSETPLLCIILINHLSSSVEKQENNGFLKVSGASLGFLTYSLLLGPYLPNSSLNLLVFLYPFTPKISKWILLTVCLTFLLTWVLRNLFKIQQGSLADVILSFNYPSIR